MSAWGNMYFLKADVKAENIWDCIRGTFPDYELTEAMPKHFSIERDNSILLWDCPNGNKGFAEFRFYTDTEDGKRGLTMIVFDKEVKPKKWTDGRKNVHALLFEETADAPNLQFCHTFFAEIKKKKLVPNVYFQSRIIRTCEWTQQRYQTNPDFPVVANYYADKDGNFFFPKEWIEKFKEDLWFITAAEFRIFPEFVPSIKKQLKNSSNSQNLLPDAVLEQFEQMARDTLSQIVKTYSRLEIDTEDTENSIRIAEILPEADIPYDSEEQYKELKNQIISSVDYELNLAPNIQNYMPGFLDKMREEDLLIRQKAKLLLKELGLDENQIEAAFNRLDELEKENAEITQIINEQAKRINELETENSKLRDTTAAVEADISSSPLVSSPPSRVEADAQEIRAAIDKLEHELQELQNTKKLLEGELSSLNTKRANLQNQYDEWEAMLIRKQNEKSNGCIYLEIPCTEENLFPNEIQDYLYSLLYEMLEKEKANLPGNKQDEANRKRDVVANLLEKRKFYWEKSVTGEKLREIENMLRSTQRIPLEKLKKAGFLEIAGNTHPKYYFYNEKYTCVFPGSSSDKKAIDNIIHQIERNLFLMVRI